MRKEVVSCDCCGSDLSDTSSLCDYDLCHYCQVQLLAYALSHVTLRVNCKTCKGKGTVRGERTDSPSCGENRRFRMSELVSDLQVHYSVQDNMDKIEPALFDIHTTLKNELEKMEITE